eukprot:594631-Amphidinium_carterae.1
MQQLKAKLAQQKPLSLGSQLNSAEARVKKATQKKTQLEDQLRDTQTSFKETEVELQQTTQMLEEVKVSLNSGSSGSHQPSTEPAVADATAG